MTRNRKVEGVPKSLAMRLLESRPGDWPKYEAVPPPAIQVEAARELVRLEGQVTLHVNFLVGKKLLGEFVTWADGLKRPA